MEPQEYADLASKLAEIAYQWIVRKLEAGEGFSALLVSGHDDGNRMTMYQLDAVEDALQACQAELADGLGSALAYALVYDAWRRIDGELVRHLIFQIEHRLGATSALACLAYAFRAKSANGGGEFERLGSAQAMGNGEKWLVAPMS